jgi:excisionase family DNA binding protein
MNMQLTQAGFSVRQIAQMLNVKPQFIRNQIHCGNLKGLKFNRKIVRVLEKDLEDWLKRSHEMAMEHDNMVNKEVAEAA